MDYYEDKTANAHILKITKPGEVGVLLAFKSREAVKEFAEVLVQHVPSIETQNHLKMHQITENLDQKPKASRMEFEIIIRKANFGIYDDTFKKFFLVQIENLDSKI